ncbi:MAG: hypothetical protein WC787_03170 [Patescibacteria group bacterium]|jgi:hypothetical protein
MQGGLFDEHGTRSLYLIEGSKLGSPANDNDILFTDNVTNTNVVPLHCGCGGCSERFMSVYRLLFPEQYAADIPPLVS